MLPLHLSVAGWLASPSERALQAAAIHLLPSPWRKGSQGKGRHRAGAAVSPFLQEEARQGRAGQAAALLWQWFFVMRCLPVLLCFLPILACRCNWGSIFLVAPFSLQDHFAFIFPTGRREQNARFLSLPPLLFSPSLLPIPLLSLAEVSPHCRVNRATQQLWYCRH